jgi:dTDP-4-amino-4,6-dideoxygalactose transaminase
VIPFLDLSFQTLAVSDAFQSRLARLISANQFIGGREVIAFEREFARYCGARHCVGLNSGTDALQFALAACGIRPEREVITSPFSFIATTEAAARVARVVFADIDPDTWTLSVESAASCISKRTAALLPVHIFGNPADMGGFRKLAGSGRLHLIEDACQAHGARLGKSPVGSLGDAAAFSFYPTKNLGAFGDAGALTTRRKAIAERVRLLRNHGQTGPYQHSMEGFNSRLDAFQALALRLKLRRIESWNRQRRQIASWYREFLHEVEAVRFQQALPKAQPVHHVFGIQVDRRDELAAFLQNRGIGVRVIYPTPVPLLPAYRHLGYRKGSMPAAEKLCRRVLCLPCFPGLRRDQVESVALTVKKFYAK